MKTAAGAGALGAVAAASSFPTPAISQGHKELKLVSTYPKNFPGLGTSVARVSQRITSATGGRVTVKLFDGGELVPPFGVFDAVSQGNADMYFSADYYFPSKSQAFNFFTTVPFGMTAPEHYAWVRYGGGQELWDDLHAQFGMKPFIGPSTGVQMGGWLNKKITKIDDFKGVKFRMPGLGGEVLRSIGVAVVNLPPPEIFAALQSGTVDGAEWVGPWHDLAFGFHKVVKNYHYPGFHEPATMNSYGVNLDFWNSLAQEDRELIQYILEAECFIQTAEYDGASPGALNRLTSELGVELVKYPDDLLAELGRVSGEVVDAIGNTDATTKKVWDSYRDFRKIAVEWGKISVQGFMNARSLTDSYG
jgi:TRAP-type mannitol/chloroaromatic compound transport system substrate-binding protein